MQTFDRKKFVASAEAYLEGRRQKWLASVKGPLEAVALKLARQDWILETEGLDAVRVQNLMPDCHIQHVADAIEAGKTPERDAKIYLANLAIQNLKDVAVKLQYLEHNMPPPIDGQSLNVAIQNPPPKDWRQNVNPADPENLKAKAILEAAPKPDPNDALLIGDEPPDSNPPLPVGEPPLSGEVRGYVAEVKHSPAIKHVVEIHKHFLYTFDKSLAETAKAAKVQNMHTLAVWTVGEFGCRLESIKFVDAPKPIEEIIP